MNQLCKVCGEPAAGFHFGAFTCEGCKSFFGRTYNNISAISGCKNNGDCVINKKNRTACKACRLRKCLLVGMSKSGSRYGRRSNWFKIHCLLQEQQSQQQQQQNQQHSQHSQHHQQQQHSTQSQLQANFEQLTNLHQQFQLRSCTAYSASQHKSSSLNQSQQQKHIIKTANVQNQNSIVNSYFPVQHLLNGGSRNATNNNDTSGYNCNKNNDIDGDMDKHCQKKSEHRISESASDSGASSADPDDPDNSSHQKDLVNSDSPMTDEKFGNLTPNSDPIRSASEPLRGFPPFTTNTIQLGQQHHEKSSFNAFIAFPPLHIPMSSPSSSSILSSSNIATVATVNCIQDEPIDLSVKSIKRCRTTSPKPNGVDLPSKTTTPLDLTLVVRSPQPTSG